MHGWAIAREVRGMVFQNRVSWDFDSCLHWSVIKVMQQVWLSSRTELWMHRFVLQDDCGVFTG